MQGVVTINGARVSKPDIIADNGVIHVVEEVLLAPAGSVAALAAADPRLSSLLAAVTAAGLAETFTGPGNFTVFAPTDEAFAALGDTSGLDMATLTAVLARHVLPTAMYSKETDFDIDNRENCQLTMCKIRHRLQTH